MFHSAWRTTLSTKATKQFQASPQKQLSHLHNLCQSEAATFSRVEASRFGQYKTMSLCQTQGTWDSSRIMLGVRQGIIKAMAWF
jgi:hypothetical protein